MAEDQKHYDPAILPTVVTMFVLNVGKIVEGWLRCNPSSVPAINLLCI